VSCSAKKRRRTRWILNSGARCHLLIRRGSYGLGLWEADRVVQANGAWCRGVPGRPSHYDTLIRRGIASQESNMRSGTRCRRAIFRAYPVGCQKSSEFRLTRSKP